MMLIEKLYEIYLKHPVICTDSRKITPGCLFFALKGEHFDGNTFAEKAVELGAAFAIVDNKTATSEKLIEVSDVLAALQALATHHRKQLHIPVIGITGSNGKTTTKELLYAVLSQHYCTFATHGNLNNHIGVPLSILSIRPEVKIAIIEMGANHQQEIAQLCHIAQPTHGLITNIGKAHLEGFGGLAGVRKGKGELYDYLAQTGGVVFVSHNNFEINALCRQYPIDKLVFYGSGMDNYISGTISAEVPFLSVVWKRERVEFDELKHEVSTHLTGSYNVENVLAAICVGAFFELRTEEINAGISGYIPVNNRSQITKTEKNTLICDYYNANPSSMSGALENLDKMPGANKVLILGDMFELGTESPAEHAAIILKALAIPATRYIFIGVDFYDQQKTSKAEFYKTVAEAEVALRKQPIENSTVLIKGSRGMHLEKLVSLL
ncbi:MAG: UDP-N-acetylmuramoyl-tripeptide--D-alanyl-D-alanine ligase [Sphingobacteriaceae bacterium]